MYGSLINTIESPSCTFLSTCDYPVDTLEVSCTSQEGSITSMIGALFRTYPSIYGYSVPFQNRVCVGAAVQSPWGEKPRHNDAVEKMIRTPAVPQGEASNKSKKASRTFCPKDPESQDPRSFKDRDNSYTTCIYIYICIIYDVFYTVHHMVESIEYIIYVNTYLFYVSCIKTYVTYYMFLKMYL